MQPGTKAKQPYFISRADGAPLAFAGLWERWRPPQGEAVESCSIIVTAANALVQPIHDRMPVLLDPEDFGTWLDPDNHDTYTLTGLLRSYPAERMQAVPVSLRVNNPRNDDAGLMRGDWESGWRLGKSTWVVGSHETRGISRRSHPFPPVALKTNVFERASGR